jgi:hypothetical protein
LRRVFVDGAVAIVIERVANFRRRLLNLSTYELTEGTLLRASSTNAQIPRRTGSTTIGIALVGLAIAIVVDPVARLCARSARHARIRLTIGACVDHGYTRTYATSNRSKVLVDVDVAIVIDAIARFGLGISRYARLRHSTRAIVDRGLASAHAAHRNSELFIDRGVAIIVDAVARFRTRQDVAHAYAPFSISARLLAWNARSYAFGARRPGVTRLRGAIDTLAPFVDLPIAIVVGPVATFDDSRRKRNAIARHSIFTRLDGDLTRAHSARDCPKAIVEVAIAIVIGAIAHFCNR